MKFNAAQARKNISIEFVDKDYSRFSVFPVVISYILDYLHLDREFKDVLKLKNSNSSFSETEYLLFLLTCIFLGVKHLYKAGDLLSSEHQLAKILGFRKGRFPSARGLYRLLSVVDHWTVKRLDKVNFLLIKRKKDSFAKKRFLTIDIDQTKKLTEGKTIELAKPCYDKGKRGKLGLRLSLCQVEGLIFSQALLPGNVGSNKALEEQLNDTLNKLNQLSHPIRQRRVREKKIILRIDGGYFSAKTLAFLEDIRKRRRLEFIIRCRSDLTFFKEAKQQNRFIKWQKLDETTTVLRLSNQQVLQDSAACYTVLIVRQKQERIISRKKRIRTIKKLVEYALVTTFTHWQSKRIIKFYKKRQTIENIFKDFNQSFEAETLPSHAFWGNAFYFQMVSLVSNIAVFFKAGHCYQSLSNGYIGNHTRQIYQSRRRNYYITRGYQN